MIGHQAGSTHSYFSGTPDVYRWCECLSARPPLSARGRSHTRALSRTPRADGLFAVRKYVEVFSNGVVIYVFFLRALDAARLGLGGGVAGSESSVHV